MARYSCLRSEAAEGVSRRFFVVIDALVNSGALPSLSGFCSEHGLSAPRYRALRLAYGPAAKPGYICKYNYVEVSALVALVANYPVSGDWLLSGRGKMLKE